MASASTPANSLAPTTLSPIIFKSRGTPDLLITVFDQEFHTHSAVLRLYSEYFFKFLDSVDKTLVASPSLFLYEWVTKVDMDGSGWMLTCAGAKVCALKPVFLSRDYI